MRFGHDELIVIRHAPACHGGRLCGRLDVDAALPPPGTLGQLRTALKGLRLISSPARRCLQTAAELANSAPPEEDGRLWEQDFGVHDGVAFEDLPDYGPMSLADLAAQRAVRGESFTDMAARAVPALEEFAMNVRRERTSVAVVAHAGTARAALGLALGAHHLGLAFEIAPLSLTRLRCHADGFGVIAVNQPMRAW